MGDKLHLLDIDGIKVPVKIVVERRQSTRVALGSKHVILRIPKGVIFGPSIEKHITWATSWLRQLRAKRPEVLDRYLGVKEYKDGHVFAIGGRSFVLDIGYEERESGYIKLEEDARLKLKLPARRNYDEQKLIRSLLIKFCQKYFLKDMHQRVDYYNRTYFGKEIGSVKLKYNRSNWGSCSTGKNLNFSVRLYFAPTDVIDYVVVHELAHLVEMNHSDKFWKIVGDILPDYRIKEKVLKENSAKFDF